MKWTVKLRKDVVKHLKKLPEQIKKRLVLLSQEISCGGPVRGNWPNYSRLSNNRHHCHLKKGQPAYVAVWEVVDKEIKLVEVTYAGTHEKAPY